jgi:hypothetical protein
MNSSLEVLKQIYKPYRYTIKGNITLLHTTSGDFVVKKKNNDIKTIYNYLKSRNFDYFPNLIDNSRSDVNVFEYVEDYPMPKEQKAMDLIDLVTLLHNKTTYYKVVSDDAFKSIYDAIKTNIDYLQNYYEHLINNIKNVEYMSPSQYLIIRNSSKIFSSLDFCNQELNNWFELIKEEKKQRVALIHNNLSLDHFIKNEKEYLISWDQSKIDSPVLDLINFYKNNYFDLDFETIFNSYLSKYPLNESEKKLLFIVISLPKKIEFKDNEFNSCTSIRNSLDYLFKTEELIRPYYSVNQEN